ncbi:histidine kinase [Flavisolibacter sp. BT320]|nr:histidine kinase [Flavisolibacter longurius]
MKKIIFVFSLTVSLGLSGLSQVTLKGLTTIYGGTPTDDVPVLAVAISTTDAQYQHKEGEALGFPLKVRRGREAKILTSWQVFDTGGVHLLVVSPSSLPANKFEYRVLKNGEGTMRPWTTIGDNQTLSQAGTAMTYLGNFISEKGSFLVIDLRRKGSDSISSAALVFFRNAQPTLSIIYLGDETKQLLKRIAEPNRDPDPQERQKWTARYSEEEMDAGTGLPRKLVLEPEQSTVIFYLKEQVQKAELLEYQLVRNGKVVTDWKPNDYDNGFVWLNNLPPGDYQLNMRFAIQRENVTSYPFRIRARWDQTLTYKFIAGGLIAAFFGFLFVLFRLRRQRQKLRSTQAQRDKAQAGLRTIYAQLNPHFIFNALSSIQGLINKGDTEAANRYLSTFSRLLRESLVHSEKESVPMSAEVQMLDTYLQLEQLRFRFQYSITVEEEIDPDSVELPALLLQPLVENAIRHGVSALQEKGQIHVSFVRKENALLATVTDNGKGFNTAIPASGFGLKLTRERIALLTEADREHAITLSVESAGSEGTTIVVHFRNWL